MRRVYINPEDVGIAYRRLALENIERNHAGRSLSALQLSAKHAAIDLVDTQVEFQRFIARCQNADRDPYAVGFIVGMFMASMSQNMMNNASREGCQAMSDGIAAGLDVAARTKSATAIVEPVAGGLS